MPGGAVIKDDHPVGQTNFQGALEQSSNVVFATLSRRLDDRVFYKYVRDFGFGIPTGIDLPGEVRGRLKRPNEFDVSTKSYMAFGYEVSATALQVLCAYAAIANNGVLMQPRIIQAVMQDKSNEMINIPPQKVRQVIRESTAEQLKEMLVGVVENGTATQAAIPGVRIAGKTGTAQQLTNGEYDRKNYTASFVGYYPADKPRVAMIVMLDRPTASIYGGQTAAPIFRRIVQKTMTMLKLDVATQERIAATNVSDSVVVPDIRGLSYSTADSVLHRLGLRLDTAGAGPLVLRQTPTQGVRLERGSAVRAEFQQLANTSTLPSVVGFSLRKAITVLHAAGYEVRVRGSGKVVQQDWVNKTCIITAQSP
jgi:cell division protein FtsI (penicillin-binding protein 3)